MWKEILYKTLAKYDTRLDNRLVRHYGDTISE